MESCFLELEKNKKNLSRKLVKMVENFENIKMAKISILIYRHVKLSPNKKIIKAKRYYGRGEEIIF